MSSSLIVPDKKLILPKDRRVVWAPIPGSSQEIAIDTRCHHTLFTGTRGPGKSDTQLMRFKRRVGVGYGPFWRGIIFDQEYKNLDDLVNKSKRWFHAFNDGAQWLASTSAYKWVWPTGEELLFRSVKELSDYDDYHGQEFPFIGWNELTKYPTSDIYDMMMSCNRSSFTPEKDAPIDGKSGKRIFMPDIPLEVFSTTNSFGVGHGWVKERFIDVAPYGKVVSTTVNVFNPKTQKDEDVTRTQVTIFGTYKENIYLDKVYVAGLTEATKNNENLRKAWLEGDWDIVAGGAFDDVYSKRVHVIPRAQIPATWYLDRTFDWGSTQPFSVGWWAEANGDEITFPDGTTWAPKPGSLIQFAEWYGTAKIGSNKGLKLGAGVIATGIVEREDSMLTDEWILRRPSPGPADNSISDTREDDVDTIEKKMADKGIHWTRSDKSSGARYNGLELMRERFIAGKTHEGPALYFMENCKASIATIPVLPRDEDKLDDVDTRAEDHPYDMARYRVLKSNNRSAKKIPVKWVN